MCYKMSAYLRVCVAGSWKTTLPHNIRNARSNLSCRENGVLTQSETQLWQGKRTRGTDRENSLVSQIGAHEF